MLPNYLASIKSSGIYRFVFDKSEMPTPEAEILRLVVGYSEKGPFNTPVYVTNEDEFKKIFGGRSKKLERYGMWFHRLAIQALKVGPILALNLKNFENPFNEGTPNYEEWENAGYNEVDFTTFNPTKSIFRINSDDPANPFIENLRMAIKDIYNTDRFWTLEPEQLEDFVNENTQDADQHQFVPGYITIASTDSKETSTTIFMRGYEPKGYDVPFMEWYSAVLNGEDLPSYLEGHERDLVSQYFAEMYVFKGEFTPEIAASDKLAKFFNVDGTKVTLNPYVLNAFGEKIDTLDALASNDASNFVNKYQGILLPDFRNASNTVISLDALVNGDNYIHKLMMRFNQDMLYSIEPDGDFQLSDLDTTGWSKGPNIPESEAAMMSIEKVVVNTTVGTFNDETGEWDYDEGDHAGEAADYFQYDGLGAQRDEDDYTMNFESADNRFGKAGIREGDSIYIGKLAHVVKVTTSDSQAPVTEEVTLDWEYIHNEQSWNESYENGVLKKYYEKYPEEDWWNTTANRACNYNDRVYEGTIDGEEVTADVEWASEAAQKLTIGGIDYFGAIFYGFDPQDVELFNDILLTEPADKTLVITNIHYSDDCEQCWDGAINAPIDDEYRAHGCMSYYPMAAITIPEGYTGPVNIIYNGEIKNIGTVTAGKTWVLAGLPKEFLPDSENGIPSINPADQESYSFDETLVDVKMDATHDVDATKYAVQVDVDLTEVSDEDLATIYKCVGSITATSANVRPLYMHGYVYGNPKPESTKQYDKLQWQHYMLDALKNYRGLRIALTSRVDLEYRYLVDTFEGFVEAECKAMLSTICKEKDNVFGILNFPKMKSFSKCDYINFRNENNEFDTKYIPMGGNPLKPMSGMFTLPAQENGASWVGFFTALRIRDIDTGVKEDVPAAALVSNNFMAKYSTYYPYTIIAGTKRGVLREQGLIGPDFNFCREDLDNLEPFGVNCMVYVDRKGTCINSNQTAKQNPVTTLSKINVRELVIFLQDEIEKLLLDYHWDFNTPNLRQRIEDRANVILETAKNNGGVFKYLNQCSDFNNTDDVINNEMLILDTSIEPGMGAGKMVQRLYIYRKGGMSSMVSES